MVGKIWKGELVNVINVVREVLEVFGEFVVGNVGIEVGCVYVVVRKD